MEIEIYVHCFLNWTSILERCQCQLHYLQTWLILWRHGFWNHIWTEKLKKIFTYQISRARMTIENAFRCLKGRWWRRRLDIDVEFACSVIAECFVLHNICESVNKHTKMNGMEVSRMSWMTINQDGEAEAIRCAKALCDDIAAAFLNNLLLTNLSVDSFLST